MPVFRDEAATAELIKADRVSQSAFMKESRDVYNRRLSFVPKKNCVFRSASEAVLLRIRRKVQTFDRIVQNEDLRTL
jgi:hypothetical protein